MTRPRLFSYATLVAFLFVPLESAFSQNVEFQIGAQGSAIPPHFWGVAYPIGFEIGKTTDWDKKAMEPFIRDLGFESIRGPGGTADNYYLWKQGILMNSSDPLYAGFFGTEKVNAVESSHLTPGFPPMTLDAIFRLPNDLNLPYIFDLNVSTQTPADIVEEVQAIKKAAKLPVSLELGNELYASADMKTFPTVKDYLKKVQAIAAAVRAVDPSLPLGIVSVGPELEKGVSGDHQRDPAMEAIDWETSFAGRIVDWNSVMSSSLDSYDAVVVHDYMPVPTLDNFTPETFMTHGFGFNQASLSGLEKEAQQFKGKPFWLTEWGVLPSAMLKEKDPAKKNSLQFMKTPGVAILLMERALNYLQSGVVTLSTYHCLDAPIGFGLVQTSELGKEGPYVTLPVYDTFKELGQLFTAYHRFYPVTLAHGGQTEVKVAKGQTAEVPDASAWAFGDESGPKKIVMINHTAHDLVVDAGGRPIAVNWTYGGLDAMTYLNNYPVDWRRPPPNHPLPNLEAKPAAKEITLAPFTVVVGTLQ